MIPLATAAPVNTKATYRSPLPAAGILVDNTNGKITK
jgi:hypothetical protein